MNSQIEKQIARALQKHKRRVQMSAIFALVEGKTVCLRKKRRPHSVGKHPQGQSPVSFPRPHKTASQIRLVSGKPTNRKLKRQRAKETRRERKRKNKVAFYEADGTTTYWPRWYDKNTKMWWTRIRVTGSRKFPQTADVGVESAKGE